MDPRQITIDPATTRLRRVGRLPRRRMRIDGDRLVNGVFTDGTLTVEITGLGSPVAGVPDSFEWEADQPIAMVIVRSGIDGEDVDFQVGPKRHGTARTTSLSDGSGIRYIAFCYDAAAAALAVRTSMPAPATEPIVAANPVHRRIAAARAFAPTGRDRRSILGLIAGATPVRRPV
jgi:hypothetical protein